MRKMFSSVRLYVAVPKNPLHDLSIHFWSQQVGATMPSLSTPIKQAGEVAWHHTYAFLFVMRLKISWLSCQRNLPNSTPFSCIVERTLEYTQEEKRQQQWLLSVCTTQIQPPNPDLKDTSAPVVASLLVQTDANFGVDMLTGTWVESTEPSLYWARKLFFDPIIIRNCHLTRSRIILYPGGQTWVAIAARFLWNKSSFAGSNSSPSFSGTLQVVRFNVTKGPGGVALATAPSMYNFGI